MKTNKRIVCFIVSCCFCLLVGCGAGEVYRDDNIVAGLDDSVDGRLDLSINFRLSSAALDDSTLQTLETFPGSMNLDVALSDGMIYGFNNEGAAGASPTKWKVYSTADEIERDLNMDIISSTEITYPDDRTNFLLTYYPDDYVIFITSAGVKTKNCTVSESGLQIHFDGTTGYTSRSMIDISDNIRHEELETADGKRVDVFIDETKEKAGIYLLTPGCLYDWELSSIRSLDDVKNFVNSLE